MESLLGKLITTLDVDKDAIHIAIIPVITEESLLPAQHIGIKPKTQIVSTKVKSIGIVDPFLTELVLPKQMFYLVLYPGSITSLRHDWEHPEFTNLGQVINDINELSEENISRKWLENFAENKAKLPYDELISGAKQYLKYNHFLTDGGKWESFILPDEFWDHYEKVTNQIVEENKKGNFFSCSC